MSDTPLPVPAEPVVPRVGYAICTVARSGSTWLSEILSSTGQLGHPSEYFNTAFQKRIRGADYPRDRRAQIERVFRYGTSPNGVYAVKVFPIVLADVLQHLRWSKLLPDLRFLYWRRRDVLGQALSLTRAFQTEQWRSTLATPWTPEYDGPAIYESLARIARQNARWEMFFARNAIDPLRLVYEDCLAAPQTAVAATAALVGLDTQPVADPAKLEIAVQRDTTTDEWRARFLAEYGDVDMIDEL